MKTVAVLVGSLRRDSLNRKFTEALASLAKDKLEFTFVEIGDLPLYNEDLWADVPAAVSRFKAEVEAADAVLFVTPEYNRMLSPALKNAADWGSRPYGQSSWAGKPSAVIGTTPGATGTAAGAQSMKLLATILGTIQLGQPEVYFQWKPELFDATGALVEPSAIKFLTGWISAFSGLIDAVSASRHAA
jgi:chromate reductase, NAD(P)H dehydrogenase (quinone)